MYWKPCRNPTQNDWYCHYEPLKPNKAGCWPSRYISTTDLFNNFSQGTAQMYCDHFNAKGWSVEQVGEKFGVTN